MSTPKCLQCDKPLVGRKDKKFCHDGCRNLYNYSKRQSDSPLKKHIMLLLQKNYSILSKALSEEEKIKIKKEKLVLSGFNFQYHTHTKTTKAGATYVFCFDIGYLLLENDWLLLVKQFEG
jgi:hypothetical protein